MEEPRRIRDLILREKQSAHKEGVSPQSNVLLPGAPGLCLGARSGHMWSPLRPSQSLLTLVLQACTNLHPMMQRLGGLLLCAWRGEKAHIHAKICSRLFLAALSTQPEILTTKHPFMSDWVYRPEYLLSTESNPQQAQSTGGTC